MNCKKLVANGVLYMGSQVKQDCSNVSQKTRYAQALKALPNSLHSPAGAMLSSAAISARRTIRVKFLEAILVELETMVWSVAAARAQDTIARSAEDISFGTVVVDGRPGYSVFLRQLHAIPSMCAIAPTNCAQS